MARRVSSVVLDWLFPPHCAGCGRLDPRPLCPTCRARALAPAVARCARCGQWLDPLVRGAVLCTECRQAARDPLDVARSAAPYAGLTKELVHRLKYQHRRRAAAALGELLRDWLAADAEAEEALAFGAATALVPVPLHFGRRWLRGFNQAELLAHELAPVVGLPVTPGLRRVRATRTQVGLSPPERRRNVAGAFATEGQLAPNGYYILVDDVYTTGATLRECARTLRRAGVIRVGAVTVARRLADEDLARPREEAADR